MTEQLKANEYRCALCGNVYQKGQTDEEAMAETQGYWPAASEEECDVVCDDCWQEIRPEKHMDVYALSLK